MQVGGRFDHRDPDWDYRASPRDMATTHDAVTVLTSGVLQGSKQLQRFFRHASQHHHIGEVYFEAQNTLARGLGCRSRCTGRLERRVRVGWRHIRCGHRWIRPDSGGAAPGTFSATLTGSDQTVATTLSNYTAADTTGTGHGWNVTFQATQFACTAGVGQCPAGGDSLPTSSLLMAPETVACNWGTSCAGRASGPSISIASNTALDAGSAVKVASAALNKGMGTYTFTPGTLGGGGNALTLAVPSYAYASTYNSTLTVSVVSGP